MKKTWLFVLTLMLVLTACGKQSSAPQEAAAPFQKTRHAEISVREGALLVLCCQGR